MPAPLPAGPFDSLRLAGADAPHYVIPVDKDGVLQAPATASRLVDDVGQSLAAGAPDPLFTDVVVVVHGWNNDFKAALGLTGAMIARLDEAISAHGAPRADFRPLVMTLAWPSILFPDSTAPAMAAGGADDVDLQGLSLLAQEVVAAGDRPEFYDLAQRAQLDRPAALRLAELLAPLYDRTEDELPVTDAPDPAGTVSTWLETQARLVDADGPVIASGPTGRRLPDVDAAPQPAVPQPVGPQPVGPQPVGPQPVGPQPVGPQAAGLFDALDPRNIVRAATVLIMKDRAGVVGFHGLGPLLGRILAARDDVRVHVVGHSYGCKASLSAAVSGLPRRLRSLLLLQPALSFLALASDVPELGRPGGYSAAKQRTELPIVATWSTRDVPLHTLFALGVRRREDLGEQNIGAAGRPSPPSRFAAMGGWGPLAEPGVADLEILRPEDGVRYPLGGGAQVLAVDGSKAISGHGDVTNAATGWALYNLVAG